MSRRSQTDMGWGSDYGPFTYTVLSEPQLTSELRRLSLADTPLPGIEVVSLQPSPDPRESNQDRWCAQRWDLPNGQWTYAGVFDGHAGADTAGYTSRTLAPAVRARLAEALLSSAPNIGQVLGQAITDFDRQLENGLREVFPEDVSALERLSDSEVRARLLDDEDGSKRAKVLRCMRGTTVLVSLTDPGARNVWVASLGDCRAVLGTRRAASDSWETSFLSFDHNGANPVEADRVRNEHPGEPKCMLDSRVLGAIAVTRSVGDHLFKLPPVYTRRVFMNVEAGLRLSQDVFRFLHRNQSPPYLSSTPEITHASLDRDCAHVLILASDGLPDLGLQERAPEVELAARWMTSAARAPSAAEADVGGGVAPNRALQVLRDALGSGAGDNLVPEERVARALTVEMGGRWMDDVTVVVQTL